MEGGTYAECVKAGFTSDQAGIIARFGGEIKDEAEERILKTIAERKIIPDHFALPVSYVINCLFMIAGATVMYFCMV